MKFLVVLFTLLFLLGCSSTGRNANLYSPPLETVPSVVFWGEDSPGKFLGKGHEKVYLCRVDGAFQNSFTFDKPTRVELGEREISICYNEGANHAEAPIKATFDRKAEYQIKLGEHSWTEVNFSVVDKNTGELVIGPISVPKVAGDIPLLIFAQ
ncbi:hypothetical protein H5085_01490 [Pseudoalteromonas sp. SR43-6]|uniref:hypothetical protein n=1 Tax=Pseudoalteromonas TaxID=53246 RepID=UPI0015FB83AC|nr:MULTISPECIES: hypothetical protein [Pseudoalteromonas]MBB1287848.1 hypothetical protein [Pseudoalteromonas sp. SR41-5]MBB1373022.1 hypothetical protein [Pseudoalteromonas sp. SR43-6]MBB1380368.1 hypothetical protein [Pseudoalteromonas sp. SR43-2]MBB1403942.1 hypothetical protein [Pseudoalteromonas sp. SG45-1]MBB1412489.1 hypothetical protein [Pseudoalteromonas sp. SG43-8]